MNSDLDQIIQLQKELAYYKKQVDRLSGNAVSNQYAFAQLSNTCKKYINGFQIIADIQRSFSFYSHKEILYEQFLEGIFSKMFLERVILLEAISGNEEMKPVFFKGFDAKESLHLNKMVFTAPEAFLEEKKSLLVNSATVTSEFEKRVQENFFTPFFILIPLIKNQQVWGILFVGMKHEFKPMSYIPLSDSNIDMFESLAGMISAMTQQLEQREVMEKERNRIARDMHDDIGSELSKIAVTCEHLKSQFPTRIDILRELDVIKNSTGSIVNNIGNIIWALNPINNTMDSLLAYMREYAFEYLDMHRINLDFDVPQISDCRVISHEVRTHIFMIVKEALHNIVKHAGATLVQINIHITLNKMTCSIIDNGCGFLTDKNSRFGNGLSNMQQRIVETGGKMNIQSKEQMGTSLEIEVPL